MAWSHPGIWRISICEKCLIFAKVHIEILDSKLQRVCSIVSVVREFTLRCCDLSLSCIRMLWALIGELDFLLKLIEAEFRWLHEKQFSLSSSKVIERIDAMRQLLFELGVLCKWHADVFLKLKQPGLSGPFRRIKVAVEVSVWALSDHITFYRATAFVVDNIHWRGMTFAWVHSTNDRFL